MVCNPSVNNPWIRVSFLALVLAALFLSATAEATIITVDSTNDEAGTNGNCTLRDAVRAANTNASVDGCPAGQAAPAVDQIIVPSGTYILSLAGANEDDSLTGDLDFRETVVVEGAGRATTIIDANRIDRILHFVNTGAASNVTFRNMTVRNGCAGGGGSCNGNGGGIEGDGIGVMNVENVIVDNCQGVAAGGIHTFNGNSIQTYISDSIIQNNTATAIGGGVSVHSPTNIRRTTISGNRVIGGSTANGGGIGLPGVLTLVDSTVSGNTSEGSGAGIAVQAFNANLPTQNPIVGRLVAINSTISGNSGATGGGIHLANGDGVPVISCLSANCAVDLHNVTITGNTATANGGGLNIAGGGTRPGLFTLANTLIANNTATTGPNCLGTGTSSGYNLIGNNSGCDIAAQTGDLMGTPGTPINPSLGALTNNGGGSQTHALQTGSVAINAGNPSGCTDGSSPLTTDQTGQPRPVDGRCDIGSYENQTVPAVCGNNAIEPGEQCDDGNTGDGDCCDSACQFETIGSTCSDGNSCTVTDTCNGAGACQGTGSTCGNGAVNAACGEQCDDGNTANGDCCNSACQFEAAASACDDGNTCTATDACNASGVCTGAGSTCGNGAIDGACGEQCDDNNTVNGDGCNSNCQTEFCGDNNVNNSGTEECDDGNTVNGDGCSSLCRSECGNGALNAGEQCDDGNTVNGDCCNNNCQFETAGSACNDSNSCTASDLCDGNGVCSGLGSTCGNGSRQAGCGEQCDDGNTANGDGCNSSCLNERCGDGSVNNGGQEVCDDGNTQNGDGCSSACQIEITNPGTGSGSGSGSGTGSSNPAPVNMTPEEGGTTETPPTGSNNNAESDDGADADGFQARFSGTSCSFNLTPGGSPSLLSFWLTGGLLGLARLRLSVAGRKSRR